MKNLTPDSPRLHPDSLRLPMSEIDHMFNAPPVDPLSTGLPEVLGVSGAEYLLHQLEVRRHIKSETLQLILPERKVVPGLADQTRQALQRYAEYRILQQQTLVRETRRQGWRLTAAAIVLLAFFLSLSSLFASDLTEGLRPLLRKTLEYGFEIIGWVMLWHPIEVLVFQPMTMKARISALRKLMELRVVVEAA